MPSYSASELEKNSKGNIEADDLREIGFSSLYKEFENEQPHFIFNYQSKGFRFIYPDGSEETPHHNTQRMNYLLITDKRIIYFGRDEDSEDIHKLNYSKLTNAKATSGLVHKFLLFTDEDDIQYKFAVPNGGGRDHRESAAEYVFQRIQHSDEINYSKNESDTEDNKSQFEVVARIYPQPSGTMSALGQPILEPAEESSFIPTTGGNSIQYANKYSVEIGQDSLKISEDIKINHEDILNVEFLEDKSVQGNKYYVLYDTSYLRIILAKFICPYCDEYSGFAESVRKHIRENDDEQHNAPDEINHKKRELFYLYLVGRHKGSVRYPFPDEIDASENEFLTINDPNISDKEFKELENSLLKKCNNIETGWNILNDWIERPGELRIEGIQSGSTKISGSIAGNTEKTGASKGVQVGPFTKSKSQSQGTIAADLDGEIEDNTFTSDINFLQINESGLYVDSNPILELRYSELNRVLERNKGILVELEDTKYLLTGKFAGGSTSIDRENISEVVSIMNQKIKDADKKRSSSSEKTTNSSSQTPAEKIQDLKQLYDDDVISEEEFESKKADLLDEL